MDLQTTWIDHGQSILSPEEAQDAAMMRLTALSRSASLDVNAPLASFWVVLRGAVDVGSREGRFHLQPGEWISLERDSRPTLDCDRGAMVLGMVMPPGLQASLQQEAQFSLLTGRGRIARHQFLPFLHGWREAGTFRKNGRTRSAIEARQAARLLRIVADAQSPLNGLVDQCPGRSLRRKRQVFGRMQRARLYLEGNIDRAVRISELAELSNVSIWHFTKTFHALYGEGPQAAASKFRLQHAKRLLAGTRLSVGEVGAACGFENNCSFSRAFRARYGAPPSACRDAAAILAPDFANTQGAPRKAAFSPGH